MYFTSLEFKSELNRCIENKLVVCKGINDIKIEPKRRNKLPIEYLKIQHKQLDNLRLENSKLLGYIISMHNNNSELTQELNAARTKLLEKTYNEKANMEKILKDITVCERCQITHSLFGRSPEKNLPTSLIKSSPSSPTKPLPCSPLKLKPSTMKLHRLHAKSLVEESATKVLKAKLDTKSVQSASNYF